MKGYIHSFESLAALDGEGLRCAVFMQKCHLRCAYCHNPDTWTEGGQEVETDELVKKILRYKPYFKETGGVTFSGGEPLLQAEFLKDVVSKLSALKINYAIDTSGSVPLSDTVRFILSNAQLIILDLKFWDDESYRKYTGQSITRTLELLKFLDSINKRVWLRTVIVPGINDNEAVLENYLKLICDIKCVEKYELLGFHTMGFYKYENLNIKNPLADTEPLSKDTLNTLQTFVNEKLQKK